MLKTSILLSINIIPTMKTICCVTQFSLYFIIGLLLQSCVPSQQSFFINEGLVYGTYYRITYEHQSDLEKEIKTALDEVGLSLSTFNKQSIISRVNINDSTVVLDHYFTKVFTTAQHVSEDTHGAFDITVAPLVNAWGFGFDPQHQHTSTTIDSIRKWVGYEKISLSDGKILKQDPRIQLDGSAIAKGYACDVIADVLQKAGCTNFLVDIGGEIVVQGKNARGTDWQIGINKAIDDASQQNQEVQQIISITDRAMATSGNYRQFYYENDKKIAHTIDPRTGFPTDHSLLSVTVLAKSCMLADAYATAFMVMGDWDEILQTKNSLSDTIQVFCIFQDKGGKHIEIASPDFEQYLNHKKQ
ncbi:MAG: FAD:protein FMN transferase [Paludibacteraceae bacterium]|nr:FAD:protein FMN transferase [Paludibacteraceae bacterium]MBP6285184.1 FAD:protein FMN transferase [Paludibacteraceae bacterium]